MTLQHMAIGVLVVALFSACGEPLEPLPQRAAPVIVRIETADSVYSASGDRPVNFRAVALQSAPLYWYNCPPSFGFGVQSWDGSAWRDAVWEPDNLFAECGYQLLDAVWRDTIAGGIDFGAWPGSPPLDVGGIYRITMDLYSSADPPMPLPLNERASNAFRVVP